jgi:hypothetical protein
MKPALFLNFLVPANEMENTGRGPDLKNDRNKHQRNSFSWCLVFVFLKQ